jgi:type II secretory pathway component PulF
MSQWIAIGERSGKTDRVFSQLRSYFQDEVEQRTGKLLTLVEPVMIALIGVFLIALISGVIVPLFTMYGSIL